MPAVVVRRLLVLFCLAVGAPPAAGADSVASGTGLTLKAIGDFADDVETGTLRTTDSPPGRWSGAYEPVAANTLSASMAAEHRGTYGLRFSDGDASTGEGQQNALLNGVGPLAGSYHLRFWFRLQSNNDAGALSIAQIVSDQPAGEPLIDFAIANPGGRIEIGGFDAAGYLLGTTPESAATGVWRLGELHVEGVGTASGVRRLVVDGVVVGEQTGLDWTGWQVASIAVGGPWSSDRTFTGLVDFDDLRAGAVAPAARLEVALAAAAAVGDCLPVEVSLRDAYGATAPVPYALTVGLPAAGISADLFSDAGCTTPASGLAVAAGVGSGTLWLRPTSSGLATVTAAHPDLLSGSASLDVAGATPDHLTLEASPGSGVSGAPLSPGLRVAVQDTWGTLVAAPVEVTVDLGVDPTGAAVLGGTRTVTTVGGVAAFDDLVLDRAASGYTLTAAAAGVAAVETAPFDVTAGPADQLRVLAADGVAEACGAEDLALQVVDAFDNPVAESVEVTLTAGAPSGAASIVATTLAGAGAVPAASVTGRTGPGGDALATVTLDAADVLTLSAAATSLPGAVAAVDVRFTPGPVDAGRSEVTAADASLFAGGETTVTVVPRDGCGVPVGAGRAITLDADAGMLSAITDAGDGVYSATLFFPAGACPALPVQVSAVVDGVALDAVAEVVVTCLEVDPDSPVQVTGAAEIEACTAEGAWAELRVLPVDAGGRPLRPGQSVRIDADPPLLVEGAVTEGADPETGAPVYRLQVGSDRCGAAPRPVTVRVGGVALSERPALTFACPEVLPEGLTASAVPDEAPADGRSAVALTVFATDRCGNPAFDRPVNLEGADPSQPILVLDAEPRTRDALGDPLDGAAVFSVASEVSGRPPLAVTVGGATARLEERVRFTLADVVDVQWWAEQGEAVVGQEIVFELVVTSRYAGVLDLVLSPSGDGLSFSSAEGAERADAGWELRGLREGESRTVRFQARLLPTAGPAGGRVDIAWSAQDIAGSGAVRTPETFVQVAGRPHARGCECGAGGEGGAPSGVLLGLLLAAFGIRRGAVRSRRGRGSSAP